MKLPAISFEFFPPKTPEGRSKLQATRQTLSAFGPEYFSVTFGAGGSTREGTLQTVQDILAAGQVGVPHLSCVGAERASLKALLQEYQALGVKKIVALRGDLPSGYGMGGEFRYARDLVEFIRTEFGETFEIWVAAYPEYHPQARSPADDIARFADKVKAGASGAITQYFYNTDAYFHFLEQVSAQGVDIERTPIVPGVMPIASFTQLARFSDACGAELPRWMRVKLASYGDDVESIRAFGTQVVADLVDQLAAVEAPALHFYTLNQPGPTAAVLDAVGYSKRS
ncbi:5,10-methylenetetrahydrofolate reductase [beta proteobacterium AAP99]|nr:5,10-methylenetetrahydrofolate reductase [beta proteobacterium AAP99]